MKKYKVRIKEMPSMAYGGQNGYGLDLGRRVMDNEMRDDNPYSSVSDTLQPVPRHQANLEAERGETVVGDVDGDGMQEHMKIGGKRHSEGGTPLNLRPGSFVFSDTRKMRVGGAPLEMFGKNPNGKKKYTPAQLAKQYDLNKYKAIIEDPHSDPLAKQTAQMMMENNQKKLGQLALLQESLKGFPQGIPDIAQSVLPQGMQQGTPQEMPEAAYGGLTKYQSIGQVTEDYRKRTPAMSGLRGNSWTNFGDVSNYYKERGYNGDPNNVDQWQKWMIENSQKDPEFKKQFVSYLRGVPLTNKGKGMFKGMTVDKITDDQLMQQFNDGLYDFRAPRLMETAVSLPQRPLPQMPSTAPGLPNKLTVPTFNFNPPASTTEEERDLNGPQAGEAGAKYTMPNAGYLTPDKLTAMQALWTKANLPTIRPYMQTPGYVKPKAVFMDPTRDYAANAEMANMMMQGMRTQARPQQFLAGASQVAGKTLAANEAAASAVNKQNVMIANQYEQQGAQMDNQYMANRAQAANLYGEMANNATKENFRNDNAANAQMVAAANNAWNNRMMTNMTNAVNPYFMLDSRSGMVNMKNPDQDIMTQIRGSKGGGAQTQTYPELMRYATETLKMPMDEAKEWVKEAMKMKGRSTTADKNNDGYPDYATYSQAIMPYMAAYMQQARGANAFGAMAGQE